MLVCALQRRARDALSELEEVKEVSEICVGQWYLSVRSCPHREDCKWCSLRSFCYCELHCVP